MSHANGTSKEQPELFGNPTEERTERTRNSMLWAAYADALGFISELVDERGLKRRTNGKALDRLMHWRRRIGGRGGVDVELPAGSWSDDTQLRLAVSRAISRHGFDVESFARIELPIWPAYALGGGRASKAAATNLGKPDLLWYANTFPGWFNAGGNGAAMRIQPHVWSSPDLDNYLLDVIVDSVCTHGHPRAIVGACFHASTLAHCMRFGTVPDLNQCGELAVGLGDAIGLIEGHRFLGATWIGLWERETSKRFRDEWKTTIDELCVALSRAAVDRDDGDDSDAIYRKMSVRLGLELEDQRGSGILTPVAAVALAAVAPNAYEGVLAAANAVGTDTDTIGTMAGALLGACRHAGQPPEEPLDKEYLEYEADRLVAISRRQDVTNHSYPDVLTWTAPQTQADALVRSGDRLVVEGLGPVTELGTGSSSTSRNGFAWQWVRTSFGQTLLIKRRPEVRMLGAGNDLTPPPAPPTGSRSARTTKFGGQPQNEPIAAPLDRGVKLDAAVEYAKRKIADNRELGYTVRRVARDGSLGDLVALVTAIRDDLRS